MVLISAVIPAPDEGSNPAIVSTTGGKEGMTAIYPKKALQRSAGRQSLHEFYGQLRFICFKARGLAQKAL
jgi:hypothetical protein